MPLYGIALGGVRVMVAKEDLEKAQEILGFEFGSEAEEEIEAEIEEDFGAEKTGDPFIQKRQNRWLILIILFWVIPLLGALLIRLFHS